MLFYINIDKYIYIYIYILVNPDSYYVLTKIAVLTLMYTESFSDISKDLFDCILKLIIQAKRTGR